MKLRGVESRAFQSVHPRLTTPRWAQPGLAAPTSWGLRQCPSKHHTRTEHGKAESELDSVQRSASQTTAYFFMPSMRENKLEIYFSKKKKKIKNNNVTLKESASTGKLHKKSVLPLNRTTKDTET